MRHGNFYKALLQPGVMRDNKTDYIKEENSHSSMKAIGLASLICAGSYFATGAAINYFDKVRSTRENSGISFSIEGARWKGLIECDESGEKDISIDLGIGFLPEEMVLTTAYYPKERGLIKKLIDSEVAKYDCP